MNEFLGRLVRLLIGAGLLAAAFIVAASFAFAALILVAGWGVYVAWARLTGRPWVPFSMRFDPRAGFSRFFRRAAAAASPDNSRTPRVDALRGGRGGMPPSSSGEVTDVEARSPRS